MHRVPIEPFVAVGVKRPNNALEIALAGLEAYWPLYQKNKSCPQPLLEFAVRWLRGNIPPHREQASFIQFDSGQFLFEGGRLTALYDFEFAMIGDPMTDLATMRMRDSYESLGRRVPGAVPPLCIGDRGANRCRRTQVSERAVLHGQLHADRRQDRRAKSVIPMTFILNGIWR